jgi:hypothetical protein
VKEKLNVSSTIKLKSGKRINKNMNKISKTILAVAAVGALSLTAKANLIDTITGSGSATPGSLLTITSYTPTPIGGGYDEYEYSFVVTKGTYTGLLTPVVGSFSVNFMTGPFDVINVTGGQSSQIQMFDVNWQFNPETTTATVSVSFDALGHPVEGTAQAQDSTSYAATGYVWVPGVPDGGLTVALLGGSLVALQAFRRKLFC